LLEVEVATPVELVSAITDCVTAGVPIAHVRDTLAPLINLEVLYGNASVAVTVALQVYIAFLPLPLLVGPDMLAATFIL
jgi:hypothetical protein